MILIDVNVLVYAHREDAPNHSEFLRWLETILRGPEAYGVNDHILSDVLRVLTHPRVFNPPTPLNHALVFTEEIRGQPYAVPIHPGPRHWEIFVDLGRQVNAKGNMIPDAYFAALAIESGSDWITTDRDYSRFQGLRWRHPLSDA